VIRRSPRSLLALLLLAATLAGGCNGGVSDGIVPSGPTGPTGGTGPTDPLVASLLSLHNAARASAAPAPSPALPKLGWSDAAARAAQAWADRCDWGHDPSLDALQMGQNIFAVGSTVPVAATPADAVGSWVGEAADYHYATNTCNPGKVCGHYTAVVWRSTTSVGCGHRTCTTGSPFGAGYPYWDFWVCNYAPPGNWVGQRPY
jgi:hypothetical protein